MKQLEIVTWYDIMDRFLTGNKTLSNVSYIDRLFINVKQVNVVFDRYIKNSLKSDTREARGSGQQVQVKPATTIPKQFKDFLSIDDNKRQLFHMIADYLTVQP